MNHNIRVWIILVVILSITNTALRVVAQSADSPLIIVKDGDLYTRQESNTALIQKTNWHYNKTPILSYDGTGVAYKAAANITVEAIKQQQISATSDGPNNLWIMQPDTGNAEKVADQAPDATFMSSDGSDHYLLRSLPSWSPDSQFMTWTQVIVDKAQGEPGIAQLVVYDVKQKQQTVIVPRLPTQFNVLSTPSVVWGNTGIAVWSKVASDNNSSGQDSLLIYDRAGNLLNGIHIDTLMEFTWITNDNAEFLGILAKGDPAQPLDNPQWLLVDPLSGRIFGMPGLPEMYSTTTPNGLSVAIIEMEVAPQWQIMNRFQTAAVIGNVDDVYAFTHAIGISRDGRKVAYIQQGAAYIFDGKNAAKIADSDVSSLVWGPTAWRVRRQLGS